MTVSTLQVELHTLPEYEHTLRCMLLEAGLDISHPVENLNYYRTIGSSERTTEFTNSIDLPFTLEAFNNRSDVLPSHSVHLRYADGKKQLRWVGTYNDLLDYAQVVQMSKDDLKLWIEYCKQKYARPPLEGQDEEYRRYLFERCLKD